MNRSITISIVLAVLALVWVLSGSLSSDETTTADNAAPSGQDEQQVKAFKVKTKNIQAQIMNDQISLQGNLIAKREIQIRAETEGSIAALSASKGETLRRGQAIANIAVNDRQARLDQAKAELKVRQADLASGLRLKEKKLISTNQHEQNIANVEAAKAAVKQIQVEIQHTHITAAFAGILNDLHIEKGDYVSAGDPIANLVDASSIKLSADVPQQHINKLVLGQVVVARLLDGTEISGTLSYISSSANSQTRTFHIEAQAENTLGLKRFGQSASIEIRLGEQLAHKLSPSSLDLDSDGGLLVKGVTQENRVETVPVTIIRNEADGMWLSGIPDKFKLITVGQGFVQAGDLVEPVADESGAAL
jgi:multidrug efflux system membrane fusion protein